MQWRDDIRDVRIRLLHPNTRTKLGMRQASTTLCHPVVDLLGRVGSREAEVLAGRRATARIAAAFGFR